MSRSTKPRKAYRPRKIDAAATYAAIEGAGLLHRPSVHSAIAGLCRALLNLQRAVEPEFHLRVLADMANVAEQLSIVGICADADSRQVILQAQQLIAELCERHAASGSWTMRAHELRVLDEAIQRHRIQLEHCSRTEYDTALDAVVRIVQQALAGNAGCKVIQIGHIDGSRPWREHQPGSVAAQDVA